MKKKIIFILFIAAITYTSKSAVYNVMKFGARNDGLQLTTWQIQNAIDSCFLHGGGIVYVPQGEYLTGTLNLKSNVELYLEKGAILKATTDLSQYQRHNEQLAGILYTEDAENVSITGQGKIFGQGMEFMYKDSAKVIRGDVNNYIRQKFDFRKVEYGLRTSFW